MIFIIWMAQNLAGTSIGSRNDLTTITFWKATTQLSLEKIERARRAYRI